MGPRNMSSIMEFQLLGFQSLLAWQAFLFVIFLCIYLLNVTGTMLVIIMVSQDPHLHTPMFVFLKYLSLLEILCTSTIMPWLLANLSSWAHANSFPACVVQCYFFMFFGATECFLLATMAYDCYLPFCSLLPYSSLMSADTCCQLVALCWLTGVGTAFPPSLTICRLDFCGPNQINHFSCSLPPLMQLTCSSVHYTELLIFILSIAVLCVCFFLMLMSYISIVSSILRIPSVVGHTKAFSTCGSHLAVVTIYYMTMISMYMRPDVHLSPEANKVISVSYTVVTPLLNLVIYSLRNRDFKQAVRAAMERKCSSYRVRVRGGIFIRCQSLGRHMEEHSHERGPH
ncbi:Olfactory receptor 11L1 [Heterocephalus glaber]|uniref:Olfactory receptor 11L1 n=1 Tax=Heterocephalus glaber TaxID=10181 RepID=G5B425_HETGA|nr:Olfactory receptor 11L1 [Heterocephalus glaber]